MTEAFDEMTECLNKACPLDMDLVMQHAVRFEGAPFDLSALQGVVPEITTITAERAMTLFWWWNIDQTSCYENSGWRNALTSEEKVFIAKLDELLI